MSEVDKYDIAALQEQIDDLQYQLNLANAKHDTLVQYLLDMSKCRLDKLFGEGRV